MKLGQIIVFLCFASIHSKDRILSLKRSLPEYPYVLRMDIKDSVNERVLL